MNRGINSAQENITTRKLENRVAQRFRETTETFRSPVFVIRNPLLLSLSKKVPKFTRERSRFSANEGIIDASLNGELTPIRLRELPKT